MTGGDNVIANGTYEACGQILRRFICKECGVCFNSRSGTAYEGLRSEANRLDLVMKCLNEGMSVRATARTVGCSVSTVQRWAKRASGHAASVLSSMGRSLTPAAMQFDEMSGALKKPTFGRNSSHLRGCGYGHAWIHCVKVPLGVASRQVRT